MFIFCCGRRLVRPGRILLGHRAAGLGLLLSLLASLLAPSFAHAEGFFSGVDSFLNDWEGQLTAGSPSYYEGQQRGYLYGGSANLRFPRRSFQPITFSAPGVKAGCGGISVFGGAFSMINMEQFTQYLQAIAQNALGMAFNMALTTLCPQCATVLSKLDDTLQKSVAGLKSSCQAAAWLTSQATELVGPETIREVSQQSCTAINSTLGVSEDTFGGAFRCPQSGGIKAADAKAKQQHDAEGGDPKRDDQRIQGNVFWKAWRSVQGELPELTQDFGYHFMSLYGTYIVSYDAGDRIQTIPVPARMSARELLEGWAGEKEIYRCIDDVECLVLDEAATVAPFVGVKELIATRLSTFAEALKAREKVTVGDFLRSDVFGLPVIRLLVEAQASGMATGPIVDIASKYLAAQALYTYTTQIEQVIRAQVARSSNNGAVGPYLAQLKERHSEMLAEFTAIQREVADQLRNLNDLVQMVKLHSTPGTSMFGRHSAFAAKLANTGSKVGR